MDDEIKILFTNTNAFIQVRYLKDIPWKDLFPRVPDLQRQILGRACSHIVWQCAQPVDLIRQRLLRGAPDNLFLLSDRPLADKDCYRQRDHY